LHTAFQLLERIRALPLPPPVRVMNVCGGHERTIAMAGLRAALPANIELIAGPGCPVCVCPEEDIHAAIALARRQDLIVVSFGDMLRVPSNGPRAEPRSLEEARAQGADVRPIASPLEALKIAGENPTKEVVFFAAGFETTMAPVAGLVAQGVPANLSLLISGRKTWPAVAMILDSEETVGFEALIAPGHVAAVMGAEEWRFVTESHQLPTVISGFTAEDFLAALYKVLVQVEDGRVCLENAYRRAVAADGNPTARRVLGQTMDVVDANWRGIGVIPQSGFVLKSTFETIDARRRFAFECDESRKRVGEMPPGCDCARVVLGKIRPPECALYGKACTPRHPIGPCMVSDEGACRIWWSSGVREDAGSSARG
jgi:hydrogenase expression/formation protein HypD